MAGDGDEPYRIPTEPLWHGLRCDGVVSVEGREEQVVYLAFRPLIVCGLHVTEDGQERYDVAWLDRDDVRHTVVLDAATLASASLAEAFPAAVINPRKVTRLVEYLAHCVRVNQDLLLRRRTQVATALGWYGTGAEVFVAGPGRPYAVDDVKNTETWLTGHHSAGSLDGWRAAVWAAQDRTLAQVLIVAGLAAPVLRVVGAA